MKSAMDKPQALQALSFLFACLLSSTSALSDANVSYIAHRQLSALPEEDAQLNLDIDRQVGINATFENQRLKTAYVALQALKRAVYSDPFNITGNWIGPHVCRYTRVFCAPALDDPSLNVVAGIDLNHDDIAGYIPAELGLLTDLALFHINSNRFCGIIPQALSKIVLMHEFDISNNRFVGTFPDVFLRWPAVKYIDIRFNDFEGEIPPEIFEKDIDALFLNDNRFTSTIPETIGKSVASIVTFANNKFKGCIPHSIGNMSNVNQLIFLNNELSGCLPGEVGMLGNLTIFDVSKNSLTGTVPESFAGLKSADVLDISHNKLSGVVPDSVCKLSSLSRLSFSHNYFSGEGNGCLRRDIEVEDSGNCMGSRPRQKSSEECEAEAKRAVDCSKEKCCKGDSTSKPPPATEEEVILPPNMGSQYSSPPPPMFPGY
ncbi:hypothetical protein GQ457_01G000700 [Hibiscus cannabinus]